jgi:hypothetical protein
MNWREHLRVIALLANGLFVLLLIGSKGWWLSLGLSIPIIVYPVLAFIALIVNSRNK